MYFTYKIKNITNKNKQCRLIKYMLKKKTAFKKLQIFLQCFSFNTALKFIDVELKNFFNQDYLKLDIQLKYVKH